MRTFTGLMVVMFETISRSVANILIGAALLAGWITLTAEAATIEVFNTYAFPAPPPTNGTRSVAGQFVGPGIDGDVDVRGEAIASVTLGDLRVFAQTSTTKAPSFRQNLSFAEFSEAVSFSVSGPTVPTVGVVVWTLEVNGSFSGGPSCIGAGECGVGFSALLSVGPSFENFVSLSGKYTGGPTIDWNVEEAGSGLAPVLSQSASDFRADLSVEYNFPPHVADDPLELRALLTVEASTVGLPPIAAPLVARFDNSAFLRLSVTPGFQLVSESGLLFRDNPDRVTTLPIPEPTSALLVAVAAPLILVCRGLVCKKRVRRATATKRS